jgi:hypothetical protein
MRSGTSTSRGAPPIDIDAVPVTPMSALEILRGRRTSDGHV